MMSSSGSDSSSRASPIRICQPPEKDEHLVRVRVRVRPRVRFRFRVRNWVRSRLGLGLGLRLRLGLRVRVGSRTCCQTRPAGSRAPVAPSRCVPG
eukprot:scaffold71109_cov63-Phaeocystis_antarctica.AAC.1